MIKFTCGECGERLSVPDQHAGRRGICPACKGVNRIPLKAQSDVGIQQKQQVTSHAPASAPAPAARGATPWPVASASAEARAPIAPERSGPQAFEFFEEPGEMIELKARRRLPQPVKLALLIVAALALVSVLYFGLLLALKAMVPQG